MSDVACRAMDLSRTFRTRSGVREALAAVSFEVAAGRTLAVVGESGAGKTTLARIIAGLDRPTSGELTIDGEPGRIVAGRPHRVQMVFQSPFDALNPFLSIERSLGEPLLAVARTERRAVVMRLLERVGIEPARAKQRPASFSGGQLQRIVLARALAGSPRVLLCDEPTSALDVSVQAQIVNLLLALQEEQSFACVLVTHDLHVAKVLADDVLVLKDGRVQEYRDADAFFAGPSSAYGRALLCAVG